MDFRYEEFLPEKIFYEVNELKTFYPEIIEAELKARKRTGYPHKKLVLAVADHNARMITAYKGDAIGLAHRREYLARLVRVLFSKSVDGVEATADGIEDLVALNYLTKRNQHFDFLNGKMLIGTVNRGGLMNTVWEMDDLCTCFTVERLARINLDGIKFMLRINPDRAESRKTLSYCAEIINEAEKYGLPVFIEGLFVQTKEGVHTIRKDLESLVKTAGVVSGLGNTSLRKWIELPVHPEYKTVVSASTNSILVVPDETGETQEEVLFEYTGKRNISENIRGILLGRNVLYHREDPYYLATAIADSWHKGLSPVEAYEHAVKEGVILPCIS